MLAGFLTRRSPPRLLFSLTLALCFGYKCCNLQHLLLFYVKLFGNCNWQGFFLPQAIGGVQFRASCLVSSYWGVPTCRILFCPQAIGGLQLAGPCVASTIGEFQVVGLCLLQAIGRLQFRCSCRVKLLEMFNLLGFVLRQATGKFLLAGSCFAPPYWGIAMCRLALRQASGEFNLVGTHKL